MMCRNFKGGWGVGSKSFLGSSFKPWSSDYKGPRGSVTITIITIIITIITITIITITIITAIITSSSINMIVGATKSISFPSLASTFCSFIINSPT